MIIDDNPVSSELETLAHAIRQLADRNVNVTVEAPVVYPEIIVQPAEIKAAKAPTITVQPASVSIPAPVTKWQFDFERDRFGLTIRVIATAIE